MNTSIDNDFYMDYGLDPKDASIDEVARAFFEAMDKCVSNERPMKEAFFDFVYAWGKYKTLPLELQSKCQKMVDDFRSIWKDITDSMLDEFYWTCQEAKTGDTTVFETLGTLCIEIITAINSSDNELWDVEKTFFEALNLLGNCEISSHTCKALMFLLCGRMRTMLSETIDLNIEYHNANEFDDSLSKETRESMMFSTTGIYHHLQAKRNNDISEIANTEKYAIIIATAICDIIVEKQSAGGKASDVSSLVEEGYDVLRGIDSSSACQLIKKLDSYSSVGK